VPRPLPGLGADLGEDAPRPREGDGEILLREPLVEGAAKPRPQPVALHERRFAIARVRELADRQRAPVRQALEGTHERRARVRLAIGAHAREAQRVEEGVGRGLVFARLGAPAPELLVAPPESPVDLLASLRRQRFVVNRVEELLGPLQRAERLRLPASCIERMACVVSCPISPP